MKEKAQAPELRFDGFTDDWEERKLIDVKDNEDRYSYTGGPFGSDLKSSDYTEIGVRIIQLQNIGDGKFVNDYKIYTSEEKARSLNSNLIYPGEIIIAKMADPLARATILPKIEPKYLMASDGIRLKINTDYFDNYYILTLINSDVFRKEALNNSTGTTRKRIGLVTLGNLPMMIPSFEEQQKIGSLFKQLDDTIALHQRKLDLLKEQKKGYLQKMFPKNGAKVPELRFAGFADDWEERKLDTIFNKIRNAFVGTATPYYVDAGHFYLESNNIKNGQINRDTEVFINDEFYNKQTDKLLHTGDIVMVQSGHVGHTAVIPQELDGTAAHALIMFTDYKEKTDSFFLNYQFQTYKSKIKLDKITTGNTIKHILSSEMKEFFIDYPSYEEQQKIGSFFKRLDATIALHQRKLDLLKEQKKGFLQKMFV
ncbi:restriction endonuclease subunit S [Lactococcus raffinolactis]|uniref:restriction endonuclease subunit S n=1 Tax=Pseudolactococcus raffinolactis TaxID=1366 RepID=UPI0039AEAAB9